MLRLNCLYFVLYAVLAPAVLLAETTRVHDQAAFEEAVKHANPGDTIELANGTWEDFQILLRGEGTEDQPITLTVQEKGKVFITGESNLRLAGKHLVVSGLVFRDGHTPTSEVISFRRNKEDLAHHSRVTEVVIDHFNNPERSESDFWVMMYGTHNRFDHSHLVGKSNRGVTMAVRLDTEESRENHHRIDHNYFCPRPILGSNGGETLRIGTSHYSLTNSFTVVENNFFDRCNGELEIISSKSGGNVFRGNLFFESRGTLTMRHGNDTVVEDNVFFGNGVDHTGGIRVINKNQTVRNNYMEGLTGYRLGSALTIMNGVPNSPINRYHQVEHALVENNSVIDSAHVDLAAGSDEERSAVPVNSTFQNNLIHNADGAGVISVYDDLSGIDFSNNALNQVDSPVIENGFISQSIALQTGANGLKYPSDPALSGVGVSRDLRVLKRSDTGVAWYPKPEAGERFGVGETRRIEPGEGSLAEAVESAGPGDVIELAPGSYRVSRLIRLDKAITLRAAGPAERPFVEFERTALFEIEDGGSLKLESIEFSGQSAPDAAGNALIRTRRGSMLSPYELVIQHCKIADLDINHSFDVLAVFKNTFADSISISNSEFSNITGAVLALDQETDDLGLYNAEYVSISDSSFSNIGKAVVSLYRGGTDESTFGPHLAVEGSRLKNVGQDKRNKSGASLYLHGVQVADIQNNVLVDSRPIRITETVGDPINRVHANELVNTPDAVD